MYDSGRFSRGLRSIVANLQGQPTQLANPIGYLELVGNNYSGFPEAAVEKKFDTPVVLQAWNDGGADFGPSVRELFYALPSVCVDAFAGRMPEDIAIAGIPSVNGGCMYLPAGVYHLYYPGDNTLKLLVFDASDPVMAAMYLMRPGNHRVSQPNTDLPDDIICPTATITTVAPGNYRRKAVWIQNVGSENVRITLGTPPNVSRGLRLPANSFPPLLLAGPCLSTDDIYAVPEGAIDGVVSVLEIE